MKLLLQLPLAEHATFKAILNKNSYEPRRTSAGMSLTKGSELTITAAATPKQTTLRRRTLWFWVFIFDATTIALLLVDCLALTAYAKVYILLIYTDALKALGVCMPWYPKLTDLLDKCFVIYFTGCSEDFIPQRFYHWGYLQFYI